MGGQVGTSPSSLAGVTWPLHVTMLLCQRLGGIRPFDLNLLEIRRVSFRLPALLYLSHPASPSSKVLHLSDFSL